jgi:nitroreductase
MQFEDVIRGRRSIRAYTTEPVPQDLIREILDEARWAPSSRNTQAWSVWVLTGGALKRFKVAFKAAVAREEADAPDLPGTATGDWPAACSVRAVELMKTRADTLEAAGETAGPAASMARMADCFGAPVLLVFGFEACLADAGASYDTASLVQNVCLSAHDKGFGTCQSTTLVRYPGLLRDVLPGSDEQKLVIAVTLGRPDLTATVNTFDRSRAPLDEIVTWVS